MTTTRNTGLVLMIGGLAAALLCWRLQSTEWVRFAPHWHTYIQNGDAAVIALLVALAGLFLMLRR